MTKRNLHNARVKIGQFNLPNNSGIRSGIMIGIYKNKTKIGEIEVGRGSFRWYSKRAQKPTISRSWSRFADWMDDLKESGSV